MCEQSESRGKRNESDFVPPHKSSKNARSTAASVSEDNTGAGGGARRRWEEEGEEGDKELPEGWT